MHICPAIRRDPRRLTYHGIANALSTAQEPHHHQYPEASFFGHMKMKEDLYNERNVILIADLAHNVEWLSEGRTL